MFIINFCLNMFRASLCPSSGDQRPCYCIWCILVWFCWMWLVAVVGRCLVRCALWRFLFKHVETEVNNKHLIVASCWFFSLHTLVTMHGHRNLKRVEHSCFFSGQNICVAKVHKYSNYKYSLSAVPPLFLKFILSRLTDDSKLSILFLH